MRRRQVLGADLAELWATARVRPDAAQSRKARRQGVAPLPFSPPPPLFPSATPEIKPPEGSYR